MSEHYDFCGYATKNDLLCTDGRTIRRDAFKECDGTTVPLIWNHRHDDPEMVIGHALLENRSDGVYMYGKFNDTDKGRACKKILENKDLRGLSIWANQLKQKSGDVLHGVIREVSLVLGGANPGALIDFSLSHGDDPDGDTVYCALIGDEYTEIKHGDIEYVQDKKEEDEMGTTNELLHADEEETIEDIYNGMTEKQKYAVKAIIASLTEDEEISHADADDDDDDDEDEDEDNAEMRNKAAETIEDIYNTLNKKQKTAVNAIIAAIIKQERSKNGNADEDEDEGENKNMKHNAFENEQDNYIAHADFSEIVAEAKKRGSLREAIKENFGDDYLAHATTPDDYGVSRGNGNATHFVRDPEMLFPDYKAINEIPDWISRDTGWVSEVMSSTKHIPFSRIKTLHADITADEARAKGYIKGNLKREEFFTLIKRTTDPQTIYKRQIIDRDDQIDITGFDVVAWIRGEMRMMLDEEIARSAFVGDGRLSSAPDKISESHVRPIAKDSDLYSVKVPVVVGQNETLAVNFIEAAIRARKNYKGSGNPTLYTTEDILTEMLLLKDQIGHYLYQSVDALATALRVRKIVTVPVFENVTIPITTTSGGSSTTTEQPLHGIIVNLQDYAFGADKGGAISMFDDFDIDYNQNKYLIETRISGALIKPYSALVLYDGDTQ